MTRVGGKPKVDDDLKNRISLNIQRFIREREFNYKTLEAALKRENVTVSEHTIRAWERYGNKKSASIPSLPHMIALSKVLGVSLDDLIGMQSWGSEGLYEVVRRKFSKEEAKIIDCLRKVTSEYPKEPEKAILDSDEQTIRRYMLNHLLFSNLIHPYPERIQRDYSLEEQLKKEKGLQDARVLTLPGGENFPEVRNFFFAAASACYLEDLVAAGASRIGLACGRTVANMMSLTKRGKLRNVVLFPILLTGGIFAAMTITSTAIVAEAVFRHEDFGVRIPQNIHKEEFFADYLKTADALFFSMGNNQHSTLVKFLQSIGVQREQLINFAGDLLFNFLTRDGQTIDEIDEMPIEINKIAELLKNNPELASLPINLNLVSEHARRGLNTVTLACGLEKLEIAKAVFARPEPVCNILITDIDLAEALLENQR